MSIIFLRSTERLLYTTRLRPFSSVKRGFTVGHTSIGLPNITILAWPLNAAVLWNKQQISS